jgi:hypothetical protein
MSTVDQDLPGIVERDVRQGARDPADRADAVLPAQPVRRLEGVRALHHRQLSRELRSVRRFRGCSSTTSRRGAASSSSPASEPTASRGSSSGRTDTLSLGNLDAQRDWGFAGDYVQAMWPDAAAGPRRRLRDRDRHQPFGAPAGGGPRSPHVGLDWRAHVKLDPKSFGRRKSNT